MSYLQKLLGDAYKEGMSEEEISTALEAHAATREANESSELTRLKGLVSKANGEAASYKHQLQERMTAEEKQRAEAQEHLDRLEAENKELKRQHTIAEHQTKLVAAGYTAELAKTTAEAMADGDMTTIMANQLAFIESERQKLRAEAVKNTPLPPPGDATNTVTREAFNKMTTVQQMDYIKDHPNWKTELK